MAQTDGLDGREGARDAFEDDGSRLEVLEQDEVGVCRAGLGTCAGSDIGDGLTDLRAFGGVVDEDKGSIDAFGIDVDGVIEGHYVSVGVFVHPARQGTIEGIDDDDLDVAQADGVEDVTERGDGLEVASLRIGVEAALQFLEGNPHRLGHLGVAIDEFLGLQFVVDGQDALGGALAAHPRTPSGD